MIGYIFPENNGKIIIRTNNDWCLKEILYYEQE